ncbi:MAG: DUF1344 domain-containing protein [Rhodobacteraceae bacterium]|nr:DUF1344 domain-containing protein [Paracoccaceae bacterium]
MRKYLFPAVAAAMLATSFSAYAADTNTTGVIKAFDLKAMTLTLEDGTVYSLPVGFKDPGLKIGEKVTVAWQMLNTKHQADTVTIDK